MELVGKKKLVMTLIAGTALAVTLGVAGCGQNTASGTSEQMSSAAQGNNQGDRPTIFGKVKSIVGNDVEIEIAKRPKGMQGKTGSGERKKRSAGSMSGNSGGAGGMPNGGGGMPGGGSASSLEFSGEVKTITIPVGVPIEQRSGQEIKQLDIADIYAGSIIQVWTDSKDKSMITRISVTAQSSSTSSQ